MIKRTDNKGIIGICGHVGAGHIHSHMGIVQDDSAGFAVTTSLINQACPVNTTIKQALCDINTGVITVKTEDGGVGTWACRGITPNEERIILSI